LATLPRKDAPGGSISRHRKSPADPDRDTLEQAAAGAARTLGPDHSATRAFAQAATTMAKVDLWHARLALRTLRLDQREAIAEAAEG
jgi:hypothetical protein